MLLKNLDSRIVVIGKTVILPNEEKEVENHLASCKSVELFIETGRLAVVECAAPKKTKAAKVAKKSEDAEAVENEA